MSDPNVAFTLRVPLYRGAPPVIVVAYDDLPYDSRGAIQLTCEVRHAGKVIFPKGQLTCALSPVRGYTSDGIHARELVLSLVAMAPDAGSGVDDDYWQGYSPEQLEWVNTHYEAIDLARADRYCDPETGSCCDSMSEARRKRNAYHRRMLGGK